MTTKTASQSTLNASYVVNTSNGRVKVVVAKKTEAKVKLTPKPAYVKTHYSIDTNGGGYTGL